MAKAPKTIGLPLPKELRSNKLDDIQNHLRLISEALDNMYRLLLSDITTVDISGGGGSGDPWIYFGGKNATGSARIGMVGTKWVVQHYISGTYKSRLGSSP